VFSARYVDTDLPRPRWRFTGTYRFSSRLQAGLEYNPAAGEVNPIGNFVLFTETATRPGVSLGTSSDRIGTPPGPRAYYATFAKGFPQLGIGPYVSVNYSEFERGLTFSFGVNVRLNDQWNLLPMNDGRRSHLLLTYTKENMSVSLMWIWLQRPGISVSFGF